MAIIVYTDGGCDPNPGAGGWGVVIAAQGRDIELSGGDRGPTTNNRMELAGAIAALRHLPEGSAIEMRLDSQYVVKAVTEWAPGWKRRGWRTAAGEPVKNVDLIQELIGLAERRKVVWKWVRGHVGDERNERADVLATAGRRAALAGGPAVAAPAETPIAPVVLACDEELSRVLRAAAENAGLTAEAFAHEALRAAALKATEMRRKDVAAQG